MSDLALADIQRLLDLALTTDGPTPIALARLGGEVTIGKLARAYLPHWLPLTWAPGVGIDTTDRGPYHLPAMLVAMHQNGAQTLDPTDPATCHAVLVALALSYGLDPGPMGLDVALRRDDDGWTIYTTEGWVYGGTGDKIGLLHIPADHIAAALTAMVRHRLAEVS